MRYLKGETFGQRYDIDPTGLVLWLDQSDARSYGDVANWYDLSGQGKQLAQAIGGSQPPITGAVGLSGTCRDFDGGADYMPTAISDIFNMSDMTVAAWIYIAAGDNISWNSVVSKDNLNEGGVRYLFYLRSSYDTGNDKPEFAVYDGANNPRASSAVALTTGWRFLLGVRDAGNTLKLYVDNVEKASVGDTTAGVQAGTTNVTVGALYNAATAAQQFFDGLIGTVYIMSRCLSVAEIQRLYLVDKPRYGGL